MTNTQSNHSECNLETVFLVLINLMFNYIFTVHLLIFAEPVMVMNSVRSLKSAEESLREQVCVCITYYNLANTWIVSEIFSNVCINYVRLREERKRKLHS